jgi:hypothetical protein
MFSVQAPRPGFDRPLPANQVLRFGDVLDAKNRKPVLTFSGRFGSSLMEYDGRYSFKMELAEADLEKVIALDEYLEDQGHAIAIDLPDDFEHRSCLNVDNNITIKLKEKNGVWAFKCNDPHFSSTSLFEYGDRVTVKVVPGFYFSEDDKRYGVYFTLKELVFPKKSKK